MAANERSREEKVLLIAEGQLGDLLLLTPALRALKQSRPRSRISVLVVQRRTYGGEGGDGVLNPADPDGTSAVLLGSPYVDDVTEVSRAALRGRKGWARLAGETAVIRYLRRERFDTAICTFAQQRFAWWAFASGAGVRVGQRRQALAPLLTHRPDVVKEQVGVRDYYCALAEAAGARVDDRATEYAVPPEARAWATARLAAEGVDATVPLVAMHPGASNDTKVWPPASFAALADALQAQGEARVLLLGAPFDERAIAAIRARLRTEVLCPEPLTSTAHLAALLQRAQVLVSNDSGPRHLAVAVGTPVLCIMLRAQDRAWSIYGDEVAHTVLQPAADCEACAGRTCRALVPPDHTFGAYCLREVGVDTVRQRVTALLAAQV